MRAAADPRERWRPRDGAALVVVTVAAAILRFWRLEIPGKIVFDEVYYAQDACNLIRSEAACGAVASLSRDHPVLGKWLIAAGIQVFGYRPFGWRFVAALFGVIGVALTFLLARRLLRSTLAATLAAGLVAADGLHLVQSRIAMLDVLVATLALAAVLFVVVDRSRRASLSDRERLRDRPWLVAAGVTAGAAAASKWSGIPFLVVVALLAISWDARLPREGGGERGLLGAARADLVPLLVAFVAIPAVLYVVSFAGTIEGELLAAPWRRGSWAWEFLRWQKRTLVTGFTLDSTYPYTSPAWSWPILKRPVVYALSTAGGSFREILALGNPAFWLASILAGVAVAVVWVRDRHGHRAEGIILAGLLAGYVWWIPVTVARPFSFVFYVTPALPFMAIAVAWAAQRIWHNVAGRVATGMFVLLVVGTFVFFYPVWTYQPLGADAWTARIWFTDCRASAVEGDPPRPQLRSTTPPPDGWCWI